MLKTALTNENLSLLRLLMSCPQANGIGDSEATEALILSCRNGFVDGFSLIVKIFPTCRLSGRDLDTLFRAAVDSGRPEMVRALIDNLTLSGIHLDTLLISYCKGATPITESGLHSLLSAAAFSPAVLSSALLAVVQSAPLHVSACRLLLESGASPNSPAAETSVAHLLIERHLGLGLDVFLRHGLDLNRIDASGRHALMPAFSEGLCGLVGRLLEQPAVCHLIRPDRLGVDAVAVMLEKRHLWCCADRALAASGVVGEELNCKGEDSLWPAWKRFRRDPTRVWLADSFAVRWRHNLLVPRCEGMESPFWCRTGCEKERTAEIVEGVVEDVDIGICNENSLDAVHRLLHILCLAGFISPSDASFICRTSQMPRLQAVEWSSSAVPSLRLLVVRGVRALLGPQNFSSRVERLPLPVWTRRVILDERFLAW